MNFNIQNNIDSLKYCEGTIFEIYLIIGEYSLPFASWVSKFYLVKAR